MIVRRSTSARSSGLSDLWSALEAVRAARERGDAVAEERAWLRVRAALRKSRASRPANRPYEDPGGGRDVWEDEDLPAHVVDALRRLERRVAALTQIAADPLEPARQATQRATRVRDLEIVRFFDQEAGELEIRAARYIEATNTSQNIGAVVRQYQRARDRLRR